MDVEGAAQRVRVAGGRQGVGAASCLRSHPEEVREEGEVCLDHDL